MKIQDTAFFCLYFCIIVKNLCFISPATVFLQRYIIKFQKDNQLKDFFHSSFVTNNDIQMISSKIIQL